MARAFWFDEQGSGVCIGQLEVVASLCSLRSSLSLTSRHQVAGVDLFTGIKFMISPTTSRAVADPYRARIVPIATAGPTPRSAPEIGSPTPWFDHTNGVGQKAQDRYPDTNSRAVAQLGSARRLGRRGRRFESDQPDRGFTMTCPAGVAQW